MKTRFDITLSLRIAKDEAGNDKFTQDFIKEELILGNAKISKGDSCSFITWTKNTNQIMAEIEFIK